MRFLYTTCLSLLLVSSGCGVNQKIGDYFAGGEDNTTPPTPLADFTNRTNIIEIWEEDVGSGSDKQYLKLSPAITPDKIYVADHDGEIIALDSTSGRKSWRIDTDEPISGGPGVGETQIYVGTSEGEVLAFNSDNGKATWRSPVSSEVLATPKESSGVVIIRTTDGKIHGLSADNGNRLWNYEQTVPVLTLRGTSSPVIEGDLVIAGFDGGKLTAIELKTGKLLWETSIAVGRGRSDLERMVDIDAEPLIVDGVIYVGTYQGRIAALDIDTGRILWTRDISSHAGMVIDSNKIYVTDDESNIWALDRTNGSSVWKQEKLSARAATAPAGLGKLVVVGDLEGYLHWLDKTSGQFISRNRISDAKIIAPPRTINDIVYVYASDGTLAAYTYDAVKSLPDAADTVGQNQELPVTEVSDETIPAETVEKAGEQEKKSMLGKFLDIFTGSDCEEDDEQCE